MAGDWIKIEKATPRKLEVLGVAESLGIHPDHAFGLCFRFWSWCDDNLSRGDALSVTKVTLDALLDCKGFADALLKVGWLRVRNGSLEVPNFDRHLSQSAKKRAQTAARNGDYRTKSSKKKSDAPSVTKASPEKRREESVFTTVNTPSADAEPAENPNAKPATKPPPKKTREPDELFDAIAEVTGVSVKLRASLIAKICKELRAEEPPFTPAEVKEFGRRFHELCPFAIGERDRPELMELRNHVDKVRRPPPTKPSSDRSGKPAGGGGRMRDESGDYAAYDNHGVSPEDVARAKAEASTDKIPF